jgi:DNA-binding NarL/FixJ family response regulator
MARRGHVDPGRDAGPRLTRREREVAGLVAEGLANGDIAGKLFISKRTVETHVDNIKQKLCFGTRHQIIAWVLGERFGGSSPGGRAEHV